MELGLNNLKKTRGATSKKRRIGRGSGSGRGTYSGHGQKGQKARSGGRRGLKRKGLMNLLRNKPKIGGVSSGRPKLNTVNLAKLEAIFENGEEINSQKLLAKNIIKAVAPGLKILGEGTLTKKFTVVADAFSSSAKKAIIDAGGKAQIRIRK